MRICPVCQTRYDDAKRFCRKEGAELVPDRAVAPEVVAKRELLERRLAEQPEDASLLEELGDLLGAIPLYDEALVQYFKALEFAADPDPVRRQIAHVYLAQGEWADAAKQWEVLVGAHPADLELLGDLAEAYVHTDRKKEAAALLSRMTELAPGDLEIWSRRRNLLTELRKEGELLPVYRRITELDPDDLSAWLGLAGRFVAEKGSAKPEDWARIDKRLTHALAPGGGLTGQKAGLARLYAVTARLRLGSPGPGTGELLRGVDPKGLDTAHAMLASDCLFLLGEAALAAGEEEQAIDWQTRALKFQENPRARLALARIYENRADARLAAGRYAEAAAECDAGLSYAAGDGVLQSKRRLSIGKRRNRIAVRAALAVALVAALALGILWFRHGGPFGDRPDAADLTSSFGGFLKAQDFVHDFEGRSGGRVLTFTIRGEKWKVIVDRVAVMPNNDDTGSCRGTLETRWEKDGTAVSGKKGMPPELLKLGIGPRVNDARYNRFTKRWKW